MDVISETKTLHLGVKNWAIDLTFCTWLDDYTEKKLHPESYFWSFSTLVPGIIRR